MQQLLAMFAIMFGSGVSRRIKINRTYFTLSVVDKGSNGAVSRFSWAQAVALYLQVKAGQPGTWDLRVGADVWEVSLSAA